MSPHRLSSMQSSKRLLYNKKNSENLLQAVGVITHDWKCSCLYKTLTLQVPNSSSTCSGEWPTRITLSQTGGKAPAEFTSRWLIFSSMYPSRQWGVLCLMLLSWNVQLASSEDVLMENWKLAILGWDDCALSGSLLSSRITTLRIKLLSCRKKVPWIVHYSSLITHATYIPARYPEWYTWCWETSVSQYLRTLVWCSVVCLWMGSLLWSMDRIVRCSFAHCMQQCWQDHSIVQRLTDLLDYCKISEWTPDCRLVHPERMAEP